MWKIVKSEIYYQNDIIRFSLLYAMTLAITSLFTFYYFNVVYGSSTLGLVPEYLPQHYIVYYMILPSLIITYVIKQVQMIALDVREKRARQLIGLPVALRQCGYSRVVVPILITLSMLIMGIYAIWVLSYLQDMFSTRDLQDQLQFYTRYLPVLFLITFTFHLCNDKPGSYLIIAFTGILAIITFTPGMLIYYENQLIAALLFVFSATGSLALSVVFAIIIWQSFVSRIYWDSISFNLSNIVRMIKGELGYFGSRMRLRYQLLIGFILPFLMFGFLFENFSYYQQQNSFASIFVALLIASILVYMFHNIELLRLEIAERRVKLLGHLPIKHSSIGLARIFTPYMFYLAFIVIFTFLYNLITFFGMDYRYHGYDRDYFAIVAITTSLTLIAVYLLRLFSEIPGRILFVLIAIFMLIGSFLNEKYIHITRSYYASHYNYYNVSMQSYVYNWQFLIEFSKTLSGALFLSGMMAIVLYYSYMNRKSYLK